MLDKIRAIFKNYKSDGDKKVLVSNFVYLSLLQIASYVFPFITIPYLSRVIGADGYGSIAFAAAVMVWIQTVADWGFNLTSTRDVAKNRDNNVIVSRIFSETFFARCLLSVLSFIILVILIILVPKFRNNSTILLFTFLMVPGQIMFPEWFFQAIERMKYITYTNLIVKFVFTLSIFIFIRKQEDYIYQPLLISLGYIIAGVISMYIIINKWNYKLYLVSFKDIIKAIRNSTDVFINSLFPNLYNSFSVVLLGFWSGPYANGIYSEGGKFVNVSQNFLSVIQRVFFPFLSRKIEKHNSFVLIYVGTATIISIALFLSAPLIIKLLYTPEFTPSINVLRILAFSLIFLAMGSAYGTNYLIVQKKEKILRKFTMYCSIFGFIISFPLIYYFSFIGAAITVTLSRMSLAIVCAFYVSRLKKAKNKEVY